MILPNSNRYGFVLAFIWILSCCSSSLPSFAASALAAWAIRSDGVLELRTKPKAKLKAFYQAAGAGKGDRVWIDIPGELSSPRKISGNGL